MKLAPLDIFEMEDRALGVRGFICLNSLQNGMAFGGCRISSSVSRVEVEELARCMTLKLAAHGLPVGGAKGGIQISPSAPHVMEAIAAFAKAMKSVLGTTVILGKDLGATTEMLDHLYASLGIAQLHILKNGAPAYKGPTKIRDFTGYQNSMTGLGVATAANRALGGKSAGKRLLIQGCGAVGVGTAVRWSNLGGVIAGISDVEVAALKANGMSVGEINEIVNDGRIDRARATQLGFELKPSNELMFYAADLLVLAAASHSVNSDSARRISVPLVVEGSNFGLIPDARTTLFKRGILVIPDVIASSSSAAMVAHQMASRNGFSYDQLWQKILTAIESAVDESVELAKASGVDVREAYVQLYGPKVFARAV